MMPFITKKKLQSAVEDSDIQTNSLVHDNK